jgi:hypothetical protein
MQGRRPAAIVAALAFLTPLALVASAGPQSTGGPLRLRHIFVTDETTETGNVATGGYKDATACCDAPVLPEGAPLANGAAWQGGPYGGGSAVAIVVANRGKRHFSNRVPYNHYSLLATIEQN